MSDHEETLNITLDGSEVSAAESSSGSSSEAEERASTSKRRRKGTAKGKEKIRKVVRAPVPDFTKINKDSRTRTLKQKVCLNIVIVSDYVHVRG